MSGRPHTLRRRLEWTLVAVALVSVLLMSLVNFVFARALIDESVDAQLGALRDTRVQAVERAATRIQSDVSTIGVTPSVITALTRFAEEYDALDVEITAAQTARLEAAYDEALEPVRATGAVVNSQTLMPSSASGRYVQEQYIVDNPYPFDDRDRLDDAGDPTGYSQVHATYHPLLRELMDNAQMSDLLLVDAQTNEVVYSTKKRIDIGTNLADGPYAAAQIGQVYDKLSGVTVGDAVLSDTAFYPPAGNAAVMFVAAAVRSGPEVIGAVITELPVSVVTGLVTGDGSWQSLGIGGTRDAYIIGTDGTFRTDALLWREDLDGYLRQLEDRGVDATVIDQIRRSGSAVLLQSVDGEALSQARRGETFIGSINGVDGDDTFAASAPLAVGNLGWVVIVEQGSDDSTVDVGGLLRGILLVVGILVPTTVLLAILMARTLTKPFDVLVAAAARIARGEPATGVDDLGRNELGDVGKQLEAVAAQLEAKEAAILAEERNIHVALGAAVPTRLIDRVRRGERQIDDLVDTATVISMSVGGLTESVGSDTDAMVELVERLLGELDELVDRHGVERARRSSSSELYLAGLGASSDGTADGAGFAADVIEMVAAVGAEHGYRLTARAGIATGDVATGVIGDSQVAFGVWGDAVTTAVTLMTRAAGGTMVVDAVAAATLDGSWRLGDTIDAGLVGADSDVDVPGVIVSRAAVAAVD